LPIYEYKCTKGHVFEAIQSMSDDPLTKCEQCGAAVERVFHPVAVHFKGSGFYSTDYGSKGKAGGDAATEPKAKDAADRKKKEKAAEKAPAKSDSGSGD
jgi:putative FmdB family regulatory protein